MSKERLVSFTVDAHLLEELGSRLVGKPSIALAELIKNAYDADAKVVTIEFFPQEDRIVVMDDGHGMSRSDVIAFWMRIGTTHKRNQRRSRLLERPLTGSKGVGRLSVQFLAHELHMTTVPHSSLRNSNEPPYWVETYVDWRQAVSAGDLTRATATYREHGEPLPWPHGTRLVLTSLKRRDWSKDDIRECPPFGWFSEKEDFEIRFVGPEDFSKEFEEQLRAVERIQTARILGEANHGKVHVKVEFWKRGNPYETHEMEYHVKDLPGNKGRYDPDVNLRRVRFEIRIYKLRGRQPEGIRVGELRDYLDRFAGVHVYDGGFRLPYYGDPTNDWLRLEYDHAHRIFESKILPRSIQEEFKHTERLRYLPTLRRVIGIVQVNTAEEPGLEISITRDRLVTSKAHDDLRNVVRLALDWYAYLEAKRAYEEVGRRLRRLDVDLPALKETPKEIQRIVRKHGDVLPAPVREQLERVSKALKTTLEAKERREAANLSLLLPLATAGMMSVAMQHEMRKLLRWLERIRLQLTDLAETRTDEALSSLAREVEEWLERAKGVNDLFEHLAGDAMREARRFRARMVVEQVLHQVSFFARGVSIKNDVAKDLLLPPATFAEWGALFQNVFVNAFNAMRTTRERRLWIHDHGTLRPRDPNRRS